MATNRSITIQELSDLLGVHRNTMTKYMKQYGIKREYHHLSQLELDNLFREFRKERPNSGRRYFHGFVRHKGSRIQRHCLIASMKRVDPVGVKLREKKGIVRRDFQRLWPNALWCMDGHHKLILWGFVIHGFIDAYCCTVSNAYLLFGTIMRL